MVEVVITEFMDSEGVEQLAANHLVLYDPTLAGDANRLKGELANARALVVRNKTIVTAEVLDSAPDLRIVARLGVGLDNIDVVECEKRGVEVAPAIGANAAAVAEYVITALLMLFRGSFRLTTSVSDGRWPREAAIGREVMGKRLGLIGFGLIAREVARRAETLGMNLAAYDPYLAADDAVWDGVERFEDISRMMAACDAVSVHVPLTEETRNLIDDELIASMRNTAVLVNTARGGIVQDRAVVRALREGRLGGAALDVFVDEPLDKGRGETYSNAPNLILTPHIAGITVESEVRTAKMTVDAVQRALGEGA